MKLLLFFLFLFEVFNIFSCSMEPTHSNLRRNTPEKQIPMQNVPLQIMPDLIDLKNSSKKAFYSFEHAKPFSNILTAYPVIWPHRFPKVLK